MVAGGTAAYGSEDAVAPVLLARAESEATAGGGIFITAAELARVRMWSTATTEPCAENARILMGRADSALTAMHRPFRMTNVSTVTYHGCSPDTDGVDHSLAGTTSRFMDDGDRMRTLALLYAISGDTEYAMHAVLFLTTWASRLTPVNLHDLPVDYAAATLDGQT